MTGGAFLTRWFQKLRPLAPNLLLNGRSKTFHFALYPCQERLYELCYKKISESCAQAKDRREYKKITKNIAQLIKWKGNDTAKSLIEELMQRYPRKPALLDELEKVEKKL